MNLDLHEVSRISHLPSRFCSYINIITQRPYTTTYDHVALHKTIHVFTPLQTIIHLYTEPYTSTHDHTPLYTNHAPLRVTAHLTSPHTIVTPCYTITHYRVLPYQNRQSTTPPYTIKYHCTLACNCTTTMLHHNIPLHQHTPIHHRISIYIIIALKYTSTLHTPL